MVPVVDRNDDIIGLKDRAELDYSKDIFRTASLWITNSNGDVLIAQRRQDKKVDPGKWAEAVGGIVEGNDMYEQTIVREAKEELGLTNITMMSGPKQFIDSSAKYFVQWFTASIDVPIDHFTVQKDEVEQIAWIPIEQLRRELIENPNKYIPVMPEIMPLFT